MDAPRNCCWYAGEQQRPNPKKEKTKQFARAADRMQQLFKENCCWYAGERQLSNKNVQKRETPELNTQVVRVDSCK